VTAAQKQPVCGNHESKRIYEPSNRYHKFHRPKKLKRSKYLKLENGLRVHSKSQTLRSALSSIFPLARDRDYLGNGEPALDNLDEIKQLLPYVDIILVKTSTGLKLS